MDLSEIVRRLDVTRARVESEVSAPGIVAITSASRHDGRDLVAAGLAYGLAGVGHRVLLVDGDTEMSGGGRVGSALVLDGRSDYDILSYVTPGLDGEPSRLRLTAPGTAASASGGAVRSTFAYLREMFAYTVIDTSVLVTGLALALTRVADGVVIALKQGRGTLEADRELVKALHASHTPVLGVVTSTSKAIRDFKLQAESYPRGSDVRVRSGDDGAKATKAIGVRVN